MAVGVSLVAAVAGLADNENREPAAARFWPAWRGPLHTGSAPSADPPVAWSETRNLRWKTALPGEGHSTPIVWGDKVFVSAAVPFGESIDPKPDTAPGAHDNRPVTRRHRFVVMALSRADGSILWNRTVREALPHEGGHVTASLASNSPVTDGRRLYAFFGSRGLYALDFSGAIVWEKDFGLLHSRHAHGEGSSPALHGNTLIVNWDHEGESRLRAIDTGTGHELWAVDRDEMTSWSTPLIVTHAGQPQVIVSATQRVRSYDLATGSLIWECGGLSRNVVASPVAGNGLVYVSNSYDWQAMLAIRIDGAAGDITGTDRIVWSLNRLTPYVPSPLLHDNTLYFLRHNQNVLSCLNPTDGTPRAGPFRLDGLRTIFASPVAAADRVYVTDREGTTLVMSHGDAPKILAVNRLNDRFSASAALVDRELYLRGERFLYCLAEPQPQPQPQPEAETETKLPANPIPADPAAR